jgi:hypothetical protein
LSPRTMPLEHGDVSMHIPQLQPPPSLPPSDLPVPSQPPQQKASLNSLPRELKLKIVELVHAESERAPCIDPFGPFWLQSSGRHSRIRIEDTGKAVGPTALAQLSLVNKEYYGMAVPLLWEVRKHSPSFHRQNAESLLRRKSTSNPTPIAPSSSSLIISSPATPVTSAAYMSSR